jgi:hypothetical protein
MMVEGNMKEMEENCKILEIKYTICKMKNTQGLTANINNKR